MRVMLELSMQMLSGIESETGSGDFSTVGSRRMVGSTVRSCCSDS